MKPMHESHARRRWPGFGAGFALLASLLPLRAAEPPPSRGPDEVLLVSNENSPVSLAVAADYARKRKVTHRLSVRCNDAAVDPDNETLSFADYRQLIERPLLAYLRQHDGIEFIVLTKGVPIRISGADTGSRDEHSPPATPLNSSVDSRLAALGYDDFPGTEKNADHRLRRDRFGRLNRYWNSHEPFSHAKFGGYLVTRLDGYTEADAKALVARALAAEQALPAGKILFDVQPGFGLGDKAGAPMPIREQEIKSEWEWPVYNADMEKAHDLMAARRVPDEIDLDEAFVGHRSNLMGYFSWGSNDPKFSAEAYLSLTFAPGSIGDNRRIHQCPDVPADPGRPVPHRRPRRPRHHRREGRHRRAAPPVQRPAHDPPGPLHLRLDAGGELLRRLPLRELAGHLHRRSALRAVSGPGGGALGGRGA